MQVIEVTQEDIEQGIPLDSLNCPLARALKRKFPDADVGVLYTEFKINNRYYVANQQIRTFVMGFDAGESIEPFSFDLDQLTSLTDES